MSTEDIKNDWRITGQEDFLLGAELVRRKYDGDDHEHCVLCWHKFMKNADGAEDCSAEGYVTADGEYWLCDTCYNDFKEPFGWKTVITGENENEKETVDVHLPGDSASR